MNLPNPRIGVGVFVLNGHGQLVLGKRKGSIGAGTWALPGGHLDYGETFEECAERETMEETGLTVRDTQFLTATNDVMNDEGKHYVTIFMVCRLRDESAMPQVLEQDKCEAWEWVMWDEIVVCANHLDDASNKRLFLPMIDLIQQRPGICPNDAFQKED